MTDRSQVFRGIVIRPRQDGAAEVFVDGAVACNSIGQITFVGDWRALKSLLPPNGPPVRLTAGAILPPFIDAHIHIPQFPIRGRFTEGVVDHPPEGRLLAGLNRNVFPAEEKCSNRDHTEAVVRRFLGDTLRNGVVGGAAYMTVHASAARIALSILPETWHVGLVMMNQNCPANLRTDEANFERDVRALARDFGRRLIVTDRFAVATNAALRTAGARLARDLGLRTQTHLNEQISEKTFVEDVLYPDADSYTQVYARDGLLSPGCLLAHCIQMREDEWKLLADTGGVVAHCPTSNALLGSGICRLDEVKRHGLEYAICTDVGASPTTSLLAEATEFLNVHAGRSVHATPAEALHRITGAPARILGLDRSLGGLEVGGPMSFVEVDLLTCDRNDATDILTRGLFGEPPATGLPIYQTLENGTEDHATLEALSSRFAEVVRRSESRVARVVVGGATVFER